MLDSFFVIAWFPLIVSLLMQEHRDNGAVDLKSSINAEQSASSRARTFTSSCGSSLEPLPPSCWTFALKVEIYLLR